VTLFGMSAGSADTVALTASPMAAGLFQRAAVEGDSFWNATGSGNSIADKDAIGLSAWQVLGCDDAIDRAACLRAVPAQDLVLAAGWLDVGPLVGGTVLPRSAMQVFEESGVGVPLLIGSNREEFANFMWPYPDPLTHGLYMRNVSDLVSAQRTAEAVKLYPQNGYDSLLRNMVTMFTDAIFTCPTRRLALGASSHQPTFRYLYTHVMENDPDQAQFFAGHSFEDTFLWHHFYPQLNGDPYVASAAEEALSATMSDYWTNFARTGDPNGSGLTTWPTYDAASDRLLLLDNVVTPYAAYHVPQCQFMDSLPAPFATCGSLCRFYTVARWWHRFRE
jgi:para-nitrobenzyl esterase